MSTYRDRTFDYIPRLVEENMSWPVAAHPKLMGRMGPSALDDFMDRGRWWTPGVVLDQGREGACVGFGCAAEALASPMRWKPVDPDIHGPAAHLNPAQRGALEIYRRAKEIDEWEGVDYEGTSVRAGMLVGRERGWWSEFYWATNMRELRAALELGPVVVGVTWTGGMYDTDSDGMVTVTGNEVGGHCLLITGYSPRYGKHGPRYRWRNSWGVGYGRGGNGYISPGALNEILFNQGGECAVPVGRS